MWLGFSAAFIGMIYALTKFFTVYHLRQMRERIFVIRPPLRSCSTAKPMTPYPSKSARASRNVMQHPGSIC